MIVTAARHIGASAAPTILCAWRSSSTVNTNKGSFVGDWSPPIPRNRPKLADYFPWVSERGLSPNFEVLRKTIGVSIRGRAFEGTKERSAQPVRDN